MMNLNGAKMMDRTFSLNVDDVFKMIFSDSPFFQSLLAKRNTYNITVGEWTDIDTNNVSDYLKEYKQYRNLSYTMDVNQSMAKTVSTAEVQYLYASSTPGQAYVIKSEAANMGFPLSSSFRFDTVYYLSRGETENKCNLQIYGKIVSRKNGCGIKSLIEDSTIQGLSTYVEDLTRSLLQLTEPDLKNINISNSSSFLSKESIPPITEPIFVTRDRIIAGEKSLSLRIRSLSTSSSSLSHFELYYETNMNLDEAKLLTSNATLADIEKRLASGRGFETCIITRSGMENLVVTAAKSYKKIGTYTFPVGTTPILGETIVRELDPDEIMSTFGSS